LGVLVQEELFLLHAPVGDADHQADILGHALRQFGDIGENLIPGLLVLGQEGEGDRRHLDIIRGKCARQRLVADDLTR